MEMMIIVVIGLGAMWLMSSRQRKAQRAQMSFRDNLQPGQEVMTGSGLYGTVVEVEDGIVTLESSPGTHTRWALAAIARLVEPPVEDDESEDADEEWADDEDVEHHEVIEVPDDLSSLESPRDEDDGTDQKKKPQQ